MLAGLEPDEGHFSRWCSVRIHMVADVVRALSCAFLRKGTNSTCVDACPLEAFNLFIPSHWGSPSIQTTAVYPKFSGTAFILVS